MVEQLELRTGEFGVPPEAVARELLRIRYLGFVGSGAFVLSRRKRNAFVLSGMNISVVERAPNRPFCDAHHIFRRRVATGTGPVYSAPQRKRDFHR